MTVDDAAILRDAGIAQGRALEAIKGLTPDECRKFLLRLAEAAPYVTIAVLDGKC